MAESGSLLPAGITLFITAVFTVFGLYAFSGAGIIRRLPLLSMALLLFSAIYVLRGISVVPQIILKINSLATIPTRVIVFSAVALGIGLLYLVGTIKNWKSLRARVIQNIPVKD